MYYIYKITNTINNKVYIGKSKNVNSRWIQHKSCARLGFKTRFYNAIRKYNEDSFKIEVLEESNDEKFIYDREQYWIALFDSTNKSKGYNMGLGGEGNRATDISHDTRLKYSLRSRARYDAETADRLRKAKGTDKARLNASLASRGSNNSRAKLDEQKVLFIS